jgi:hypothetical protein
MTGTREVLTPDMELDHHNLGLTLRLPPRPAYPDSVSTGVHTPSRPIPRCGPVAHTPRSPRLAAAARHRWKRTRDTGCWGQSPSLASRLHDPLGGVLMASYTVNRRGSCPGPEADQGQAICAEQQLGQRSAEGPPTRALADAPGLLSAPTRRFMPRSNRRGRGGAPGGVPWPALKECSGH